jgi:predicted Ser/Thr protein kinase
LERGDVLALKYPGEWKFEGVGFGIPDAALSEFADLAEKIAGDSQRIVEIFKSAFGHGGTSSSFGFAVYDLREGAMEGKKDNAAEFVDCFWRGIEKAKELVEVPSPKAVNAILQKHDIPLRIELPNLVLVGDTVIVDAAQSPEAKSDVASRYVLGEQIGRGGYGIVYKATKSTVVADFQYALKVLDPSPFVEDYEKALERFRREIRALQALQHRAIVQYFEAGITPDKKPYIVMPFIEGTNLRDAAASMDTQGKAEMFIEILNALDYAHNRNVIHRDLKPTNVIVRASDGQPIILDFGSAYVLDDLDSKSLTSEVVGTIGYIPSEVITNPKKRSKLHDVYACGVMLYEAIAGHRPDPANYAPLARVGTDYAVFDPIIQQAISGEATRISSTKEFAARLSRL